MLNPSPTIAATLPSFCNDSMISSFLRGRTPAKSFSIPVSSAMTAAVRLPSPASMITSTPSPLSEATAVAADCSSLSATTRAPASLPSTAMSMVVFPSRSGPRAECRGLFFPRPALPPGLGYLPGPSCLLPWPSPLPRNGRGVRRLTRRLRSPSRCAREDLPFLCRRLRGHPRQGPPRARPSCLGPRVLRFQPLRLGS